MYQNNKQTYLENKKVNKQSYIYNFVAYLTIPSSSQKHQSRHDNSIPCKAVWQIYRDAEQPQEKETSQNKPRLRFSWRQFQQQRCQSPNPIQKRKTFLKEKNIPSILKDNFSSRTDQSIFTSITSVSLNFQSYLK